MGKRGKMTFFQGFISFIPVILMSVIFVSVPVPLNAAITICDGNAANWSNLRAKLLASCPAINIADKITVNENFSAYYSGTGSTGKTYLSPAFSRVNESAIKISSGAFQLSKYNFSDFGETIVFDVVNGGLTLFNSTFDNSYCPVTVENSGNFICHNCNLYNSTTEINGAAMIAGSMLSRHIHQETSGGFSLTTPMPMPTFRFILRPSMIIDTEKQVDIGTNKFLTIGPGEMTNDNPYIRIIKGNVDISRNFFSVAGIVVEFGAENDLPVMLSENTYVIYGDEADAKMEIDKLFNIQAGSKIDGLEVPKLKYMGHDETGYKIWINNDFRTDGANSYWGGAENKCTKTGIRSGENENLVFEMYVQKGKGLYPVGYFRDETKGADAAKRYIKLPFGTVLQDENRENIYIEEIMNVRLVAHCEGQGTTLFSEPVHLEYRCPDGEINNGSGCFKKCETKDECEYNIECIDNMCQGCAIDLDCPDGFACAGDGRCISRAGSFCLVDKECADGSTCIGGDCVPDSGTCETSADCSGGLECIDGLCGVALDVVACQSNVDCGSASFCDSSEKICRSCGGNSVDLVCPDGKETLMKDGQEYCRDNLQPLCPVNSAVVDACSSECICRSGFKRLGNTCVDVNTNKVCPTGSGLYSGTQKCIEQKVTAGGGAGKAGKGGCSLVNIAPIEGTQRFGRGK